MKAPPEDARAAGEEEPDFAALEDPDSLLAGDRTRDDYLSVALQLREPTPVADIAARAGRGTDSAREYMRWFETIGVVRKVREEPEQYETNRSYLYWRRVDRIRNSYRDTEIVDRLQDVLDELDGLGEEYDAAMPGEVDVGSTARAREVDVEVVWEDVSRWKTLLARRDLLEDALERERHRDRSGGAASDQSMWRPTAE